MEEKVEEGVSKAVDKAFEGNTQEEGENADKSGKNKNSRATSRRVVGNQDLEFDDWDLEKEDVEMIKKTGQTSNPATGQESPQNRRAAMEWAKSDFVAGDEIFFEDNLAGEKLGEFPSRWDIIEGNAEVVRIDGENAIMLLDDARIIPFMENQQRFLPDVFTLEFDFY
ncbi:hypothetical protein SMA90_25635, partial [Escherichia coli]